MISTLISLPYELARRPLALVDDQLSERLSETSPTRVVLDRALGSADKLAGTVLRNPGIAERGAERLERSHRLATAARLEEQADVRREAAQDTVLTARQEADRKRRAAQERAESGLDEADKVEARGKQEATERAAGTASAKKDAADQKAAGRKSAAEQRQERVASAAEAKKRAAQKQAKAELDDARQGKEAAAEARADAERLEDLTEAKKRARKQA